MKQVKILVEHSVDTTDRDVRAFREDLLAKLLGLRVDIATYDPNQQLSPRMDLAVVQEPYFLGDLEREVAEVASKGVDVFIFEPKLRSLYDLRLLYQYPQIRGTVWNFRGNFEGNTWRFNGRILEENNIQPINELLAPYLE